MVKTNQVLLKRYKDAENRGSDETDISLSSEPNLGSESEEGSICIDTTGQRSKYPVSREPGSFKDSTSTLPYLNRLNKMPMLHQVVWFGPLEGFIAYLRNFVDDEGVVHDERVVNEVWHGMTALVMAIAKGDYQRIEILAKVSLLKCVDPKGISNLAYLIHYGTSDHGSDLLRKLGDEKLELDENQEPALHSLIRIGSRQGLKWILERDIKIERQWGGKTALMSAASSGQGDLVEILLSHSAHIDTRNSQGQTASSLVERHKGSKNAQAAKAFHILQHDECKLSTQVEAAISDGLSRIFWTT